MKLKKEYTVIIVVLVLGISGIFLWRNYNKTTVLSRNNLQDLSIEKLVQKLHAETNNEIESIVYGDRIVLEDEEGKQTVRLPDDKFYLSVAPYIYSTKSCEMKSLSKGEGEMKYVTFMVNVIDEEGQTVVNESYMSEGDGFFGLWLPRDIEATITVSYDSLSATSSISTKKDAKTCISTLHLQ